MKQRTKRIVAFLLAGLLAATAWYTHPRTAEELFPDFRWDDVEYVGGRYDYCVANEKPANAPDHYTGVAADVAINSPDGQEILTLLQNVKYRRTLSNLLPSGTRYYGPLRSGDFEAEVVFSVAHGTLTVEYWYDELQISFRHEPEFICKIDAEDEIAAKMLQWLRSHAEEETLS